MNLPDNLAAFLSRDAAIADTGLTPQELAALPHDEWLRVTGKPTLGEIAQDASVYGELTQPPGRPRHAPAAPQAPQQTASAGPDWTDPNVINSLTREQLLQYRDEIHRANGIGAPRQGTGSLSGGVGRHALVESGVDRSNAISTRVGTDQAIQAAQEAEYARLGAYIASQHGNGHANVAPTRGTPFGL